MYKITRIWEIVVKLLYQRRLKPHFYCREKIKNMYDLGERSIRKTDEIEKTVCILVDDEFKICHSNIGKNAAQKYLKNFYVLKHLPVNGVVDYHIGYHTVNISKIDLDKKRYYLILIQPYGHLYKNTYKDILTGLYNRNYWEELLKGEINYPVPRERSIIMIDIDNLKYLNDNNGYLVGDEAIRIVGQAIRESIRETDIGVRYGGDEFLILLASTKRYVAEKVVKRIRESINKIAMRENMHIEISAGIACYDYVRDMKDRIKMADRDLY